VGADVPSTVLKPGTHDMIREGLAQPGLPPDQEPYPAEKARGGEIILNTPLKRWVFVGGLVCAVVLALLFGLVH
jgi:hypothetical protein